MARLRHEAARPDAPIRCLAGDGTGLVWANGGPPGSDMIWVRPVNAQGSVFLARNPSGHQWAEGDPVICEWMQTGAGANLLTVIHRERRLKPLFGRLRYIKSNSWLNWPSSNPNNVLMSDILQIDPTLGTIENIGGPGWRPETTRNLKTHASGTDPERRPGQYKSSNGRLVIIPEDAFTHRSFNPQATVTIPIPDFLDTRAYFFIFVDGAWYAFLYDRTFLSLPDQPLYGAYVPLTDDHLVDSVHDGMVWWIETEVIANAYWYGDEVSTVVQVFRAWIDAMPAGGQIEQVRQAIRTQSLSNFTGIDVTPWNDGNNGTFEVFSAGFPGQEVPAVSGRTTTNHFGSTGYEVGVYDLLGMRSSALTPPPHLAIPTLKAITASSGDQRFIATWRSATALYWLSDGFVFRCIGDLNTPGNWTSWSFTPPSFRACGGGDSFYVIRNQSINRANEFGAVRYDGDSNPSGTAQTIYKYTPLPDMTVGVRAIWTIVPGSTGASFAAMAYSDDALYVAFGRQTVDGVGVTEPGSIWRVDRSEIPARVCGLPDGYLGGYIGLMGDDGHWWNTISSGL